MNSRKKPAVRAGWKRRDMLGTCCSSW